MDLICFNMAQLHHYGSAFYDYLGLRKRFFVDQLGWKIPHDDEVEMDQYDNPTAFYSLVLQDGELIGGGRAMATTAQWGTHTYMLRDAVDGRLVGIPADIIPTAATTRAVWECTRVVISDAVTAAADRAECLGLIVDGLVREASRQGATEMITLSRPSLVRTLRKVGYEAQYIGTPYVNADDGRRYVAMSMPATLPARARLAGPAKQATHALAPAPVHFPAKL